MDKDSRRGPDVVDLQQLIRIGQVVLLLLLILLLSTLPLLILGIVHRWFLKKKSSCVQVVVVVSTDYLKKTSSFFQVQGDGQRELLDSSIFVQQSDFKNNSIA